MDLVGWFGVMLYILRGGAVWCGGIFFFPGQGDMRCGTLWQAIPASFVASRPLVASNTLPVWSFLPWKWLLQSGQDPSIEKLSFTDMWFSQYYNCTHC
jgi:hypothetical protein